MADRIINRNDEPIYFGSKPKYQVDIDAGVSLDDFDFEVRFQRGPNYTVTPKEQMITDGEGNYYVVMDTTKLGVGPVRAIFIADVPDNDYEDGVRPEIIVIENFERILPL